MEFKEFFICNYQIGDTISPIHFPNSNFVGLMLEIPLTCENLDISQIIELKFLTSKLETWEEWQGHSIKIDGVLIGKLADTGDQSGEFEEHIIKVPESVILTAGKNITLSIEAGLKTPKLIDDFILKSISSKGVQFKIGW